MSHDIYVQTKRNFMSILTSLSLVTPNDRWLMGKEYDYNVIEALSKVVFMANKSYFLPVKIPLVFLLLQIKTGGFNHPVENRYSSIIPARMKHKT